MVSCISYHGIDEDITPSDAPADPPTIMQGPMTRARRRQLNLEVSSFLSDPFHTSAPTKNDVQVAYSVRFGRSLYGWKDNFMELPMAPVPP